ncbi:Acidic_ribosomal protein P0 [Hexamita inflata]|uniref:Acidic ribosomal protein P0 n=1 Tax=Hexamita inflata TaxID=28002 RepID=A0AA86RHR9_9EUKA|nr:Acidic ribosomal protein P0 [Hexamita inflata]
MSEQKCYLVKKQEDLYDKQIEKCVEVRIIDIYFKKLDDIPVHIQVLTINNCQLQSIKDLFNLDKLLYCDVSHNMISDLTGIEVHLELEYLNFSFNNVIIVPENIKMLNKLTEIITENNYIVNQEPLIQHENFIVKWLQKQLVPEQRDFKKCLTPGTSEEKVIELMKTENGKSERSKYLENMIQTLAPLIQGKELAVKDLLDLKNFGFVDCFDIDTLKLDHCPNIQFKELPKKIKHLSIVNSGLLRLDGLEKMQQLETINLTHNKLISCEVLKQIPNLSHVNVQGNKIQDLENIMKLPKFKWNFILPQRLAYLTDFQKYLGDQSTEEDAKKLQEKMTNEQEKSLQILYDAKQIDRLKDQVVNKSLEIKSDANITSFGFVDHWGLTQLTIEDCPNLTLERAPKKLTKLTIKKCGLKSTKGIENAKLLTHLSLSKNRITDLTDLDKLTALEELDLSFNQLYQIDQVSALVKLTSLNLQNNNLIIIEPVKALEQLKSLKIDGNMVQDLEYVRKLKTFVWEMISQQKEPKETDYQNYLEKIGSENSVQEMIDKMAAKAIVSQQIVHDALMIKKYKSQVKDKSLDIQDDPALLSIQFSDELDLQLLNVSASQNLNLERIPTKLKSLVIKNCNLKSTKGLAPAKHLTYLDLSNNLLNDLTDLETLTPLQTLDISFNALQNIDNVGKLIKLVSLNVKRNNLKIIKPIETLEQLEQLDITENPLQDLQYVKLLPKLKWETIVKENSPESIQLKVNQKEGKTDENEQDRDTKLEEEQQKSLQILYDAKQIDRLKDQVVNKSLEIKSDANITSFGFVDHWGLTQLTIEDCPNLTLERAPKKLTKLTIKKCGLKSTKGIENAKLLTHLSLSKNRITDLTDLDKLTALEELDLSFNQLYQIDQVSALVKLTSLNLQNNNLIIIEPVKALEQLKSLKIDGNMVQDLEYVRKLKTFVWEMISQQKEPKETDYQNYLEKIGSENSVQEMIDKMAAKAIVSQQIVHDALMIKKYKSQVKDKSLDIQDDPALLSIQFSDELDLQLLNVSASQNLNLERIPTKLKSLVIKNCNLKSTKGLAPAKHLTYLDLSNNLLNDLTDLETLTPLQTLDISFNALQNIDNVGKLIKLVSLNVKRNNLKIIKPIETLEQLEQLDITENPLQDLQYVKLLPKLKWETIVKENSPESIQLKVNQKEGKTDENEQDRDTKLEEEQQKSLQILYDAKQIDRLKDQVVNKSLEIKSDANITSFGFVDHWGLTQLTIEDCPNLTLERAPKKLTKLTIKKCGLKSTKGIENAKLLTHLSLSKNRITDLTDLDKLTALEELDLSFNQLYQIDQVSALVKLTSLNLQNNNLIIIEPVKALEQLKSLKIDGNMVQDLEYVRKLKTFVWEMIVEQTEPALIDFQKYLGEGTTEEKARVFATSELIVNSQKRSAEILYDAKMVAKFNAHVVDGCLEINSESIVTSFGFVDEFKLNSLKISACCNVTLERVPKLLTNLIIYGCSLQSTKNIGSCKLLTSLNLKNNCITDLTDLDQLTALQHLDISHNQIRDVANVGKLVNLESLHAQSNKLIICEPLKTLLKLKLLNVNENMIQDLIHVKNLNQFNWDMISKQNSLTDHYYKDNQAREELIQILKNEAVISQQIIHDKIQIDKYENQIKEGKLIIKNDETLLSVEFAEHLKVTELVVMNCYNLVLERCPKNVTKLTINSCNLSDLNGIQHMTQLNDLNLSKNQLKQLEQLASLVNLTSLDLGQNNIDDISILSNFKMLNALDFSQNLVSNISAISALTQLKILDMSYNLLSNLEDISSLTNLQRLNVGKNRISSISCLQYLTGLVYLNISMNLVTSLAVCANFHQLQDLRLKSNFIRDFEPIAGLQFVRKFWVQSQLTTEQYMSSTSCSHQDVLNLTRNDSVSSKIQLHLIQKYKTNDPEQLTLKINDEPELNSLQFTDVLNIKHFEAVNCKTISFDEQMYPKRVLKLKLSQCVLQNSDVLTNICLLKQLVELDLSHNNIRVISELAELDKLTHLNLESNKICWVSPLADLPLQYLNLSDNRIIFTDSIQKLMKIALLSNNLVIDNNITNQSEPVTDDYKYVLGPNSTIEQAVELEQFQHYNIINLNKYETGSENGRLEINGDNELKDIQFANDLGVETLIVNKCENVQLERKCKYLTTENGFVNPDVRIIFDLNKLKILKINQCGLTHLQGVQTMKQLIEIDLMNNRIVSVKELRELNVEKVTIEHNCIADMAILTEMKNYNTDWIQEQDTATDEDYKKYLEQTNQKITLQEFKEAIAEDKQKTEELIIQSANIYQKKIEKYKEIVQNDKLKIENDETIYNLNFTDELDVTNLSVLNCKNIKLGKIPIKLTELRIQNSNLTSIDGMEQMKLLQTVSLVNIQINDIKPILCHTDLLSLTINNTKLTNLVGINHLKQLKYLNVMNNCIISIKPLQELVNLKYLLLDNNFIQDLESLISNNNYTLEWIYYQNTPTDADIQQYLTDIKSNMQLSECKAVFVQQKSKTDQLIMQLETALCTKHEAQIYDQSLVINGNANIKDFRFVDSLPINSLTLNNCVNVKFAHSPTKITSLTINNSKLTNVIGIENMRQLTYLNLKENEIFMIQPITQLPNLQQLILDNQQIEQSTCMYQKWNTSLSQIVGLAIGANIPFLPAVPHVIVDTMKTMLGFGVEANLTMIPDIVCIMDLLAKKK